MSPDEHVTNYVMKFQCRQSLEFIRDIQLSTKNQATKLGQLPRSHSLADSGTWRIGSFLTPGKREAPKLGSVPLSFPSVVQLG